MTLEVTRWRDLPEWEGIYAMYDRKPPAGAAAYVGETNNVRARLVQHFVRRDSSVVTGTTGQEVAHRGASAGVAAAHASNIRRRLDAGVGHPVCAYFEALCERVRKRLGIRVAAGPSGGGSALPASRCRIAV
jgi:hypothetical protein